MRLIQTIAALGCGWGLLSLHGAESDGPLAPGDLVWLANGERLRGELVSFDRDKGILWRHPGIEPALPFDLTNLVKIRLAARPQPAAAAANLCLVRLANQDELEGNLAGFDATNVTLETWYAGLLRLPREAVESIQPLIENPKIVYRGPTSLEGWTLGESVVPGVESNAWSYADGALVARASGAIARDLKLPDLASIDFDLAWSAYLHIAIALYADSLQPINLSTKDEAPEFGGFYSLQLNANIANILPVKKGMPLNSLGLAFVPGMEAKTAAHITVRCHKPERTVYLYIDGQLVKQWRDANDTLGSGTAIRFVNQGPNPLRVSNLVIAEWDGRMDLQTNVAAQAASDVVRLLNRDAVSGQIQEIREGRVFVQTPFGPVTVPLERVEQIHLARSAARPAAPIAAPVQAAFARRGRLTLQLEGWEEGRLVASHPLLGRARFSLAAFRSLEWKR